MLLFYSIKYLVPLCDKTTCILWPFEINLKNIICKSSNSKFPGPIVLSNTTQLRVSKYLDWVENYLA